MARGSTQAAAAGVPLIETKVVPPRSRPGLVERRRLIHELDRLEPAALTLVVAPVGFGKSVLVRSWCEQSDVAVAWVSLDVADDDPSRLWTYIATAVDRVRPGLGRPALARLRSPGVPPKVAVDELLNALAGYGQPLALVLDDLHAITDDECLASLEHLVERMPENARIIATTRSDPRMRVSRIRARGALGEIRARELAFTEDEAHELLVDAEGIALDEESVRLLVERTEGWPVGLYLAALWLRELDDPGTGVRDFHGDHRHVADYLATEVLDALDEATRRFLLESSVLGRFSAGLCDAALDRVDSAARLHELEETLGFLVALDPHGEWYRYHQLFGELLQLTLAHAERDAASRIHARACAWCLEHGLVDEALAHAAAAGDQELLTETFVHVHLQLVRSGRLATVLRWCAALPEPMLRLHPELPLAGAISAGLLGRSAHDRRRYLAVAELVRSQAPERWTPYHETVFAIASAIWVERDLGRSIGLLRTAVELGRATPNDATTPALASLAFLLYLAGEADEARALAEEALERPGVEEAAHGHVLSLATLASVLAESRDTARAVDVARQALSEAGSAGVATVASGGAARVALACALAAAGDLRQAEKEAESGERIRRHPEPEAAHVHSLLVLAEIRARRGHVARAQASLDEALLGLGSFADAGRLPDLAASVAERIADASRSAPGLVELPSAAEMSVLELLGSDLTQREIGARLFLSVNTVKTHTRALYRKLGASSREEAVTRAAALGLLGDDSPG